MTTESDTKRGVAPAIGAYLMWGFLPLYLLLVKAVPAFEFVAWRILWTLPFCLAFVALRRQGAERRVSETCLSVLGDSQAACDAEVVAALGRVGDLNRREVRRRFEQRFSAQVMAQSYLDLYAGLAPGRAERGVSLAASA